MSDDERDLDWIEEAAQTRFTQIPNWLIDDDSFSIYARATYVAIARHIGSDGGEVWPGVERLARLVGCGTTKINEALAELRDAGVLTTKRRGLGRTNLYRLRFSATRRSCSPPGGVLDDREAASKKTQGKKTQIEEVVVVRANADVIGSLMDAGFDDVTIENHRSAIDLVIGELSPPADTDWYRVGALLRAAHESGRMKAWTPASALRFIANGLDGFPVVGQPVRRRAPGGTETKEQRTARRLGIA